MKDNVANWVGQSHAALVGVRSVAIEDRLEGRATELLRDLDFGPRIVVVSDPETEQALGARVRRELGGTFQVQSLVLKSHPHADDATLKRLLEAVEPGIHAVVAVGSGTLNDLCKMVAHERRIPQAVFGTAPSMNGYTSVNAAITVNGLKKSIRASAPQGVFLDLSVLAQAPARLIRSGLGDSLCRPTAQADWLLAHLLLEQPYRQEPFDLLAADEAILFERSRELLLGDLTAMRHLARTLVLSGFGMTLSGGSYPASQGEHLISHYVDMVAGGEVPETFHGEQIGVTALAMAELQTRILRQERAPRVHATKMTRAGVLEHFGPNLGESCWKEFEPKCLTPDAAERMSAKLDSQWSELRSRIEKVTIPAEKLRGVLMEAGGPTRPQELGWSDELFDRAFHHARYIRNRYTFLDLASDMEA